MIILWREAAVDNGLDKDIGEVHKVEANYGVKGGPKNSLYQSEDQ